MNALTTKQEGGALALAEADLLLVLQSSLYPGAALESIKMVIGYCKAAGLDPMQKPVHIVPMWDQKAGRMRDVVMPGVAGTSEPEYGPDVTETIGGQAITYPAWCRVTVKRRQTYGVGCVDEFTAREFWKENYAIKGGKEKSIAPNAMWMKRPYGQIAKCAEAQALRKAFPELGSQPAAEEMEGKHLGADYENTPGVTQLSAVEGWTLKAGEANTEDELRAVMRDGVKVFQANRDKDGYAAFAKAVQMRGSAIKAAQRPEPPPNPPADTGDADPFVAAMDAAEGRDHA